MHISAGIFLPESVLSSPWFLIMAIVVALNTLIYIGLTLSKLIPMPEQFHPSRVRRMLRRIGINPDVDTVTKEIPRPEAPETSDPYENMRRDVARRGIPQAFAISGGIVIFLSAVALLFPPRLGFEFQFIQLGTGVTFLVTALLLGRSHLKARTLMWVWAAGSVALVVMTAGEAILVNSQLPLTYSLMIMVAFAPITLAWRPSMIAAGLMLACVSVATVFIQGDEEVRLIAATFAALLIGALLLHLRIDSIATLSDEKARSAALASTDILTGVLSRHGLLTLIPGEVSTVERLNEAICVMSVDVYQLKEVNEQYGSAYGDEVLRAVAKAIQKCLPPGDLVARWGGHTFLAVGWGEHPDGEQLARNIEKQILLSGVNLGKWPTTVSAGGAAGDPRTTTFEHLVAEATS